MIPLALLLVQLGLSAGTTEDPCGLTVRVKDVKPVPGLENQELSQSFVNGVYVWHEHSIRSVLAIWNMS